LRRMVKMTKDGFMMLVHIELSSTPNGTKIKMSVRVNLMQQQVRS
jgi:hypothetical protein